MKKSIAVSILSFTVTLTALTAPFDGTYTYLGQTYSYDNGSKLVQSTTGNVVISNDVFNETLDFQTVFRNVEEQMEVDNGEAQYRNSYTQGIEVLSFTNAGSINLLSNAVFSTDIGGIEMPFYFDTATNISINFFPNDSQSNAYNEVGIGIMIRQSEDMEPTALNGNYLRFAIGSSMYSLPSKTGDHIDNEIAAMEFDGLGSFTEVNSSWSVTRSIGELISTQGVDRVASIYGTLETPTTDISTNTMTYSLAPNGIMEIAPTMTVQVAPDAQLAVSLFTAEDDDPNTYLSYIIKPPVNMDTNAFDAVYFVAQVEEYMDDHPEFTERACYSDFGVSRSYVELRSDSTFSIRTDSWELSEAFDNVYSYIDTNRIAQNNFIVQADEKITQFNTGTYQINANGQGVLFDPAGEIYAMAQFSENGQYFIFIVNIEEETSVSRMLGLGIRRTPPAPPAGEFRFTGEMTMTSTGLVMQAVVPANWMFEELYTENILSGEWKTGGLHSSPSNTIQIIDTNAQLHGSRFYKGTFAPW